MDLNAGVDGLLGFLAIFFEKKWFAPFVLTPMLFAYAGWLHLQAWRRTAPWLKAARSRAAALEQALGSGHDPNEERAAFAAAWPEVSRAMNAPTQRYGEGLLRAWHEFHESIVDETASPIRNTTRPSGFFGLTAPKQRKLVLWSNLFVGIGLMLTFVGIIVALNTAANGMDRAPIAGADFAAPLIGLLVVASAKFFTSIAGLGASLYLRAVEHWLTGNVQRETERLCALLERGMLYVPPQRLAVQQLEQLQDQTAQLKQFNTDLALQIGERVGAQFTAAIAPVSTSLSMLNDSMSSMSRNLSEGLGQSAADAVSAAASGELRALGQTLEGLRVQLDGLGGAVAGSGEEAARQIRAAGADFAQAATDIREAFGRLTGEVDGVGVRLAEQGEASARQQTEMLGRLLDGLERTQASGADAMGAAVLSLATAGASAAETMQRDLTQALATGVQESQVIFRHALEESGTGLRDSAGEIGRAVGAAALSVERAGAAFEVGGRHAETAAKAMLGAADSARDASGSLGEAARGFAAAATPVAQAAQGVNSAAERIAKAVDDRRAADAEALAALSALATGVRETQGAAEAAWRDYRARFEGVDRALEQAAVKLTETVGDSLSRFSDFARDFDGELSKSVGKLSGSLTTVDDHVGELEETTAALRDYARALDDYTRSARSNGGPTP